jgi:hypothetical protein
MYLNDNPLAEKSTPLLLTSSEALAGFILGARHSICELEKYAPRTIASRPNLQERPEDDLKFSPMTVTVTPLVAEIRDGTMSKTTAGIS